MNSSELIVALDIGTTKIAVLVGKKNEQGKIEVLGLGKADSVGVNRGVVTHITPTVDSIRKAVEEAQVKSGEEIRQVFVGIAGQHIKSLQSRGMLTRSNVDNEISQEDIDKCTKDMYQLTMQPGDKIIDVIPQDFIVDGEMGIKNPIGMAGVRLEANFHIITGQVTAVTNIYKCVEKAGLRVAEMTLEPLASSEAVLSEEEKEAGVVLVDIGGGTTDVAIFQDKIIRHTAVIPCGGNIITDDIKDGCTILRNHAEKLKVRFGSAMATDTMENDIVAIPGFRERAPKEISLKNLAHIIQARMEEIIEQVYYEIKSSGLEKKLIAGIVVTGGGANLKNITQLFEYITGMDTRIGYPTEHLGKAVEDVTSPMYATGVGLLIKGFHLIERKSKLHSEPEEKAPAPKQNWLEKWLSKGNEWLAGEEN